MSAILRQLLAARWAEDHARGTPNGKARSLRSGKRSAQALKGRRRQGSKPNGHDWASGVAREPEEGTPEGVKSMKSSRNVKMQGVLAY